MSGAQKVRYFLLDVESVADGTLISRQKYPGENLSPEEAIHRWRTSLQEETGKDFIPYTFQIPTAIVLAKISEEYELLDIIILGESQYAPHEIVERFWRGWESYGRPTLVSFNGRGFDLPLLELAAFRYGVTITGWFSPFVKGYEQPRNRYNSFYHLDLQDFFTNHGATYFTGGLNLAASLIGKPGKMDVQGNRVQDLHDEEKYQAIEDYCVCDVLDTYFVFLRTRVIQGYLSLEEEQKRVEQTKRWLEQRAETNLGMQLYLANWGDWKNPWNE